MDVRTSPSTAAPPYSACLRSVGESSRSALHRRRSRATTTPVAVELVESYYPHDTLACHRCTSAARLVAASLLVRMSRSPRKKPAMSPCNPQAVNRAYHEPTPNTAAARPDAFAKARPLPVYWVLVCERLTAVVTVRPDLRDATSSAT
jgi:hypothetical protein